jgi:hypothetical protein
VAFVLNFSLVTWRNDQIIQWREQKLNENCTNLTNDHDTINFRLGVQAHISKGLKLGALADPLTSE